MIYINSKGEEKKLDDMNIFELTNSAQKADRVLNFFKGASRQENHIFQEKEWNVVERYIEVIQKNLWQEIKDRDVTGIDQHFHETFPHLDEATAITMKNFIKENFTLKQ
jgi:hypothetical protein